ncbi:hypothetical protein BT93_A1832 [Corymbia citriodora subsp. variegata]|nr:hypothetical protein BT93_A1832 [Corymbia citriodora subsp. variegata]
MKSKAAAAMPSRRVYEDFEPECKRNNEEGREVIELDVHGFKKEQLRVQANSVGSLTVTGERPLNDQRWIRFRKEFNLPKEYKLNETRAKLAGGVLLVIVPIPVPEKMPPLSDDVAQEKPQTGGGLGRRGSGKQPPAAVAPPPAGGTRPPAAGAPPPMDDGMLWVRVLSWRVGIKKKRAVWALLVLAVVAALAGIGVGGFLIWRHLIS